MCFRPSTAAKLKICSNCGSANQPIWTNCVKCNAELKLEEVFNLIDLPSIGNSIPTEVTQKSHNDLYHFSSIIGESSQMVHARNLAERFSPSKANILLIGESGTGKELFAQAIHNQSRPSGPFVVLNCAAIPKNLIESELFGYDGGAFTGAKRSGSQGKVELAQGGTFFLDEIGDMPLDTQAVLLRVLESKQVMRVGGQKYLPVDFRLIAATNKDLRLMVDDGVFRLDLYYRLSVLKLSIPPLCQRGKDIITLAKFFLKKHCGDDRNIPELNNVSLLRLITYHWPGNVRQLENAMIYALHVCDKDSILPEHLPDEIAESKFNLDTCPRRVIPEKEQQLAGPIAEVIEPIKQLEKSAIENALSRTGNNIAMASDLLGVSKSTLYRKIKKLDV